MARLYMNDGLGANVKLPSDPASWEQVLAIVCEKLEVAKKETKRLALDADLVAASIKVHVKHGTPHGFGSGMGPSVEELRKWLANARAEEQRLRDCVDFLQRVRP